MDKLAEGLFTTKTASEFPFEGTVIEIDSGISINEGFQLLAQKNLLSAPVWKEDDKKYLGFFDVTDVVRFATDLEAVLSQQQVSEFDTPISKLFEEKGVIEGGGADELTGAAESKSRLNAPWIPASPSTPMIEILKILAKDARRVPVIDPDTGKVLKVISQSSVTRELNKVMNTRGPGTPGTPARKKRVSVAEGPSAVGFSGNVAIQSIKEVDEKAANEPDIANEADTATKGSEDNAKKGNDESTEQALEGAAAASGSPIKSALVKKSRRSSVTENESSGQTLSRQTAASSSTNSLNSMNPNAPGPNVLPKFLESPRSCGIGLKTVATIEEDKPAIEAFKLLAESHLSAVGVIDDEGMLLSCISSKDIRLLPQVEVSVTSPLMTSGKSALPKHMKETAKIYSAEELLKLPAIEFVSKARINADRKGKARPAVVVVNQDTPFFQMVAKLAKTNMHRVFITDAERKPIGVVSVSDIVRLLFESASASSAE